MLPAQEIYVRLEGYILCNVDESRLVPNGHNIIMAHPALRGGRLERLKHSGLLYEDRAFWLVLVNNVRIEIDIKN